MLNLGEIAKRDFPHAEGPFLLCYSRSFRASPHWLLPFLSFSHGFALLLSLFGAWPHISLFSLPLSHNLALLLSLSLSLSLFENVKILVF